MEPISVDRLTSAARDAAYVSVGLGVIAFQRLQVRRNELSKSLGGQAGQARGVVDGIGAVLAERVKLVEERLGSALDR